VHGDPCLLAAAGGQLVDAGGGERPPSVDAEPQLGPPGLGVAGADTEVAVDGAGGLTVDPDSPFLAALAALAADPDLPGLQVHVAAREVGRWLIIASAVADSFTGGPP
jgi:hypothetical protein